MATSPVPTLPRRLIAKKSRMIQIRMAAMFVGLPRAYKSRRLLDDFCRKLVWHRFERTLVNMSKESKAVVANQLDLTTTAAQQINKVIKDVQQAYADDFPPIVPLVQTNRVIHAVQGLEVQVEKADLDESTPRVRAL